MSSISREQNEILALIDAIMAMTEKAPKNPSLGVDISLNPFHFLMDIITKYVSFEEMLDWLVKQLTVSLPIIELGIKGIILSNLKSMIDCNSDPRIPNWLRHPNDGMIFNLAAIDYQNIMSISPLSSYGANHYFGTRTYYTIDGDSEDGKKYNVKNMACVSCLKQGIPMTKIRKVSECSNVFKLARAEDFNAFLWFVVHKGFFTSTSNIGNDVYGIFEGSDNLSLENRIPTYSPR